MENKTSMYYNYNYNYRRFKRNNKILLQSILKQLNLSFTPSSIKQIPHLQSTLRKSKSAILLSQNTHPTSTKEIRPILQLLISNSTIISKRLNPSNDKTNNKVGSLLSLFNSDIFDIYLLLYYLKTKEEIGIIDMLITILHNRLQSQASYYLPQIIALFISKEYNDPILQYLLYNSYHSITFGLKTKWLISNYLSKLNDKRNKNPMTQLLNQLSLVRIANSRMKNSISDDVETKYRLMYYNTIESFYNEIAYFYTVYRNTSDDSAYTLLQNLIDSINFKISRMNAISLELKQFSCYSLTKNLYRGILIPIKIRNRNVDNSIDDQQSFIIVNVIKEHSTIFKYTKKAFAIKLVIECVQVRNCEQWDKLFIDQFYLNSNNSNQPFKKDKDKDQGKEREVKNKNKKKNKIYNPFNTEWPIIQKELISLSSFKVFNTYRLKTVLLEYREDFSNQEIIMQFINSFIDILSKGDSPLKLHRINIAVISAEFAIKEYYPGFVSVKEIRRQLKERRSSLSKLLRGQYGNSFEENQKIFVESLSAYSLFCYIMNITEKIFERMFLDSNGNIAIFNFANCFHTTNYDCVVEAFIIPNDFMEVMDGRESGMFYYYKSLIIRGLLELRKHTEVFVTLIQSILRTVAINGFSAKDEKIVVKSFLQRFFLKKSDSELYEKVEKMINISNS